MELEQDKILTQLLTKNYAEAEFSILNDQKKIKFRTLSTGAQLEIEQMVSSLPDSSSRIFVLHTYALQLLARTLVQYGTTQFDVAKPDETMVFLKELPPQIIDILGKLRDEFQQEVLKISTPKELEKHFFPTSSSGAESNSSTKDTSLTSGLKTQPNNIS